MSKAKAFSAGLLAGLVAAIAMTVVMLLLACFGVATPLFIIGDRLSVFIPPGSRRGAILDQPEGAIRRPSKFLMVSTWAR